MISLLLLLLSSPARADWNLQDCDAASVRLEKLPGSIENTRTLYLITKQNLDNLRKELAEEKLRVETSERLAKMAEQELAFLQAPEETSSEVFPGGPALHELDVMKKYRRLSWKEEGRAARRVQIRDEAAQLKQAEEQARSRHGRTALRYQVTEESLESRRISYNDQVRELTTLKDQPAQKELSRCGAMRWMMGR